MFGLVIHNHPHRTGANLRRKPVPFLAHNGSNFSRVGASDKPGAVQIALSKNDLVKWVVGANLGVAAMIVAAIKLL